MNRKKIKKSKFMVYMFSDGWKRAEFLKKQKIFHNFGESVFYYTKNVPSEPYLVGIGNNVKIAANVRFITHDITSSLINYMRKDQDVERLYYHVGKIDIKDNVMIGADAIILYDVTIGPNVIVGAGSVVTKDVPPNSVVAGNPARVVGTFNEFVEKRIRLSKERPSIKDGIDKITAFHWSDTSDNFD